MKKISKLIVFMLIGVLLLSVISACGSGGKREYVADYTWSEEKLTYTFYGAYSSFNKSDSDEVIKAIEEKFNVNIKLRNGGEGFRSNLSAFVQTNRNVPDVFFAIPDENYFPNWADKGYMIPINEYLDKLEERNGESNLKSLFATEQLKNSTKVNGNNYFVPQIIGPSNHVLMVRKDWMKQWAQAAKSDEDFVPTTISDFTAMLQYFHDQNLGGHSDGTYGLGLNDNFDFTEAFLSAFGVSPSYTKNDDGSYQLSAMTERYDDYVSWLREGSNQGYIIPNFAQFSESATKQQLENHKVGAYITTNAYTFTNQIATFYNEVTSGEDSLDFIPFPSSDDGKFAGSPVGDQYYWGGYSVSVNAKEPLRLIAILDYMMGEEGQDLFTYGVEDKYYSIEDGEKVVTEDNVNTRYSAGSQVFVAPNNYRPTEVYGRYNLGTKITPANFVIEEGNIVLNNAYSLYYDNGSYMKRYDDYIMGLADKGCINFRQPTFLLDDYNMANISINVLDYAKTYTLTAAKATNQADIDRAKNTMVNNSNSKGLVKLLEYLKNSEKNA